MTAVAARGAAASGARTTFLDRALGALPVVSLFVWLCLLYAWQSRGHTTPWLFTDELEFAQLSRSIAETGSAARRGDPHSFNSVYTYLTSPAWLFDDVADAYAAAKYIGVALMASVVFPAYGLARLLVGRPAALLAAAGAGAIPSLAYSSMLVQEPLAYPYATLCLFLFAKALVTRRPAFVAAAVAAAVVAPFVRGQLAVLPAVFALAGVLFVVTGDLGRRLRTRFSVWDWVGLAVLLVGAVILFSTLMSSASYSWLVTTRYYKDRMLEYGLWAAGALAVGLGVLPFVAGLAVLFRRRSEQTTAFRAFAALLWASIACFGVYTAVKAAYLSTQFGTRVTERNLIYLAPLLFVGTVLWLERPRVRLAGLAAVVALTTWVIVDTPYQLQFHLYSDSLGLAILQMLNREIALDDGGAQWLLLGMLVLSCAILLAARARRLPPRAAVGVVAAGAVLALAWNVAGEVSAARASNSFSDDFVENLPPRLDWVDTVTGGQPALYIGQQIVDPNGVHLLEFWNRSVRRVWSIDGTAPGPGPTLTPDLAKTDGTLFPQLGYEYVVADNGVDPLGRVVAEEGDMRLVHIRQPFRLRSAITGLYEDGWSTPRAAYSRYATPGNRPGWLVVTLDRKAWCGADKPGNTTIRLGRLVIGKDKQPALGRVTETRKTVVHSCHYEQLAIPTPPPPFRVEVTVDPTFSPHELDAGFSDNRQLGAKLSFAFSLTKPEL